MISHLKIVALFSVFIVFGLIFYFAAMRLSAQMMRKEVSLKRLFKGFHQKIWMTVGLGITFFGLYVLAIYAGSILLSPDVLRYLLIAIYRHPVTAIYVGLLTFACTTTFIYLARMLIKHLYNSRY